MEKRKINTVLFGLDGVIVDTRQMHDNYWNGVAAANGFKYDNFASLIDGMTFNSIIELYFSICPQEEKQRIREELDQLDMTTDYRPLVLDGVIDYLKYLKENNYKVGLVTSSNKKKVLEVFSQLGIEEYFDTVIAAESIKKGKPDPMGFVLAQNNLAVSNLDCAVYEDAFTGIKAATYAFMRVIGVATTLSVDFLKDYTYSVITDFKDLDNLKKLLQ